jgi:LppM domain
MRPVVRLIGLAMLALLSTGCIKVDLAMRLHSDDTVDGTMTYAVSRDLLTLTNSSPEDLLDQVASGGPLPPGVRFQSADYADDTFVGKTLTFTGVGINAFQQGGVGGESLSIRRVGDAFQVSGEIDLTTASTGPLQPGTAQLAKDMQLRLAITFPGPVQEQTGGTVTDPNTVTWTPTYGEKTEIRATGSALGDRTVSPLLWVALAAAVVVAVVIVLLIVRRRRSSPEPAEPAVTTPASDGPS